MKLLPDTRTFLWLTAEPERVSPLALSHLKSKENGILISAAVEWELAQWVQEKRAKLPCDVPTLIERELRSMQARTLNIRHEHLAAYARMEAYHNNPFERMLAAQAVHERYVIVSPDPVFRKYPVTVLW